MRQHQPHSPHQAPPTIVQNGAEVLRQVAETVNEAEFNTPALQELVTRMEEALASCDDGVAIAAPQIGVAKRIFVVAPQAFDDGPETTANHRVFINPIITKKSKRTSVVDEGCLSVRWLYGKVRRSTKATVEAYDLKGKKFTHHGTGLLAQIFQHEIDHLNGVLFIDQASQLEEIKPSDNDAA